MSQYELAIEKREAMTRGQLNQKRRDGNIPAIIYGEGGNSSFFVNSKELRGVLTTATQNTIYTVNCKGDESATNKQAMIKDMQYHPVSYKLFHVDFVEVTKGKKLHIKVPLKFEGEEICKKKDGILTHLINEIPVECLPKDILGEITVDVSGLDVGDSIHVSDIKFGEAIKVLIEPESTIISLTPKVAKEVEVPVAEVAEGAESATPATEDAKKEDKK